MGRPQPSRGRQYSAQLDNSISGEKKEVSPGLATMGQVGLAALLYSDGEEPERGARNVMKRKDEITHRKEEEKGV